MHAAFGTVVWIVCGVGILAAMAALLTSGKTWEEFGKDHLLMDREFSPNASGSPAAVIERDAEIRQMLEAKNLRRRRRGEQPIDIEDELRRLTATQIDPELRAEIRDLVIARNHRRTQRGEPALDVEAEIEREIETLRRL
jgi:hypothetical protein